MIQTQICSEHMAGGYVGGLYITKASCIVCQRDALAAENARLREALTRIACFDDIEANITLEKRGSYSSFDEPDAVYIARTALAPTVQPSSSPGER